MINRAMKRILAVLMACVLLTSGVAALAEQVYVNKAAAVYASPKTTAKKLGTLKAGASVELTAEQSGWAQIEKGGTKGYVKASALTKVENCGNATAYTLSATALYKTFTGKKKLGTIPAGASVTLIAKAGAKAYVKYGGKKGFVKAANLTTTAPEKKEATAYVNKEGATAYNSKGKASGTLALNTAVTVVATKNDICQITVGGKTAYVKKADLSDQKVQDKADDTVALKVGDTGDAVKKLQERLKELGYFTGEIGGNYQSLTQSAVAGFQTAAKLTVTGEADEATLKALFSSGAPKKPATTSNTTTIAAPVGDSTVAPARGTAIEMDWWTSGIQEIFPRGATAKITDVATGLAWREQRRGGTNHADVQPLTAADTAALKRAYGGTWSWNRRAIFVTINGINYAASMNGMPHGGGSIEDNNFDGHHCIHFTNSRTHGSNKVCELHQAAIKKAASAHL